MVEALDDVPAPIATIEVACDLTAEFAGYGSLLIICAADQDQNVAAHVNENVVRCHSRHTRASERRMTKTSSRAHRTRVASKAKRTKAKTTKPAARKPVSRKKSLRKKAPTRAAAKARAARPGTPKSSAWPGLPPGYFDRGR